MTNYYVSPSGSDSNSGTSTGTPWQTVAKVNSTSFAAGDSVLFEGGQTFSGTMLYLDSTKDGASGNPVTYGSYGTGRATIANTGNSAVYSYAVGGLILRDLILTCTATIDALAFYKDTAGQASFIRVINCDISLGKNGLSMGGANGGGYTDVQITNCNLHGNRDQGLFTYGPTFNAGTPTYAHTSVYVGNCQANNNLGNSANTTSNSGSGIVLGSVNGGTVEYCSATGNGSACTAAQGPAGIWAYDSTAVTIQFCVSYSNLTGGTGDGDGFDFDLNVSNSTIQFCLAYDNDGAGILLYGSTSNTAHTGNVIRYNLCWGNAAKHVYYSEIKIAGSVRTCAIYGNTLVARDTGAIIPAAIDVEGTGTPSAITIRNNIITTRGTGPVVRVKTALTSSAVLFQGNGYWRYGGTTTISWNSTNYTTLAAWRAAVANQEVVSAANTGSIADPLLIDPTTSPTTTDPTVPGGALNLRLQALSPLREAGQDMLTKFSVNPGSRDYFGNIIAVPQSVGAHQLTAPRRPVLAPSWVPLMRSYNY